MKMKKNKIVIFGAIAIAILIASGNNTIAVTQTQYNELQQGFISISQQDYEQILYDLMSTNTIAQVKQEIYEPLGEDLEYYDEIMLDVDAFFNVLTSIGVTDDMTLLAADSIIEDNWDIIENAMFQRVLKVNKYCSIYIEAMPFSNSWARPRMTFFRPACRCIWNVDPVVSSYVYINGRRGLQETENTRQRGIFIGFGGRSESTFRGHVTITGLGWISISDVDFVDSVELSSQQYLSGGTTNNYPNSNN